MRRLVWSSGIVLLVGCGSDPAAPDAPDNPVPPPAPLPWAADLTLPAAPLAYANPSLPGFLLAPPIRAQENTPADNPVTDWGATLGRVLFYDTRLSLNQTRSCASCHQQDRGFADPARLSAGFAGGTTARHSMGLVNAVYYPSGRFFWDERAPSLEAQVLMPIQDPVEMGMTLDGLVGRLSAVAWYPVLFEQAFGSPTVTSDRISRALAQFVRSMVSYQTKFDAGRGALPGPVNLGQAVFPGFTPEEQLGKALFFEPGRGNCAACHGTETFTGPVATNNGLDAMPGDPGLAATTGQPGDNAKFKVPSLRQVALRAPFMHDGRFDTLEQVVDHYSTGVRDSPTLAPQLRGPNGAPRRPNFTPAERAALVAFLRTLTDPVLASDLRWADPFRAR